jgi:hypothetical protein
MLRDMSELLIYVDTSDVRDGAVEELRGAIEELVRVPTSPRSSRTASTSATTSAR